MPKISVRSNFAGTKRKPDSVLLQEENSNLMSGLLEIETAIEEALVNGDLGEIFPDIEVTVNGVNADFLPEKLATELNEGDIVGISFITMGGG